MLTKNRVRSVVFVAACAILAVPACTQKKGAKSQGPMEVPVVTVAPENASVYFEFVGQVYGAADVEIRARVNGVLEGIHFQEGSAIQKGTLLYTIDPQELEQKLQEAKAQLAEAQTVLVRAKSDVDRYRPLAEMKAVSKRELDQAEAQYGVAQQQVESGKAAVRLAQINLGYATISAPITGTIGMTKAKVGDYVGQAPNPIVLNTISQIDPVRVHFSISEAQYLELVKSFKADPKQKKRADMPLELVLSDGSIHPQRGHIAFADRQIDSTTGSLLLEAEFPNPDKILRPGQYAKVRVIGEERKNVLLVPQRAVAELQGIFQLGVVQPDNKVDVRTVKLGPQINDRWVIEEGLSAGDRVIVEGLQLLRPGMQVVAKAYVPPTAGTAAPAVPGK